jgi:hypothetical protein
MRVATWILLRALLDARFFLRSQVPTGDKGEQSEYE